MSELRSDWTPEQLQASVGEANESLPEARTTDRFPVPGRASGVDLRAGESSDEDDAGPAAGDGVFRVPPDPPRGTTNHGGV